MSEDSFPMLMRCNLAQWRGLTQEERTRIDQDWKTLGPLRPGGVYYHSVGHAHYTLWEVEGPGHNGSSADQLLSIKVDHWPLEFEQWSKAVLGPVIE